MKNEEKFKEIFKEFATEVWAFPEKDFLTWLNAEYKEPTTKNETLVSLDVYKQVAKERDIAIQQLHELGCEFGQKIEPTTKNNSSELEKNSKKLEKNFGELDCISRKAVLDITWQDPSYADPLNVLTEVRDKVRALPSVTPQLSVPEVTALAEWIEKLTKECEEAYNKGYEAGRKELEPITSKDKFIYALTACGCLLKDGKTWYEHNELIKCFEDLGLFEQEPTIKALGEELRKARKGIADEKVLIGYNLAVAICNKHLGESEEV